MREFGAGTEAPAHAAISEASTALREGLGFSEAWGKLEDVGLVWAPISLGVNRDGGDLREAAGILRIAGYHAMSLPLAETCLLAGWALAASGIEVPEGPLTVASCEHIEFRRERNGWTLWGTIRKVPWASEARQLVLVGDSGEIAAVGTEECGITAGENLAGEPRADVHLDGVRAEKTAPAGEGVDSESLRLRGALARSAVLVGALERVQELCVEHARAREQFGRNIGRFQAVQQQLALLAGETAASNASVGAAVNAASSHDIRRVWGEVAAAKVRTSMAAGTVASIAHHVHGAIGFTERHDLHRMTLRLWAWREEFGNESEWAESLGGHLAPLGADALWEAVIDPASVLGQRRQS